MKNLISFENILNCTRRAIEIHYPFNAVLEEWNIISSYIVWNERYKNIITNPVELSYLLRAIGVGDGKENIIVLTATKFAFDETTKK